MCRSTLFPLLGIALQLTRLVAAQDTPPEVANLEHFWSYGRSPAVYPTPEGTGSGDWADAYAKAKAVVAQMTNEEKNNITYGYTSETNSCSGNIQAVSRLGFSGMCLQDAGNGVRGGELTNSYPSGLHVGASWNKDLAYSRAQFMGAEFKRKGVNVALGPVVGPLGRVARGGRNWEGFSNDPYLSGSLVMPTIQGMQESVIACVKHYIGNEQETNRNPPSLIAGAYNQSVSANIDDKTIHELYLWPFQDAIKAGAGSVMCSYNRLNDSYACQNSKSLNGLLKTELGFQGFVVSDWDAQHTGIASTNAGLDMAMPDSPYWQGNLTVAVTNGSITQSRLDDMATRILASWYKYAPLDAPGAGLPLDLLGPHTTTDARDPASKSTIFQGAVEGHVLVKNVNNALPLSKPKFLSLFGYDGIVEAVNTKGIIESFDPWQLGLANVLNYPNGSSFRGLELLDIFLSSVPFNETGPGVALNGTLFTGGGSGSNTPSYIDAPYDAFARQAYDDGTFLAWDFASQDPAVNEGSEACIVFINEFASEGWDRPYVADPYSDVLVQNVAAQCNNTMVVIHNAGVRLVDQWIENPNITAVIYAHLPGQDSGRALIEVMYGNQSPSGRLPYTVAKNESDYGTLLGPTVPDNSSLYYPQSNFTEGVYIDYKHFIAQNITPRYEFGYGLSYTTFDYSSLQTQVLSNVSLSSTPPGSPSNATNSTSVPEGGIASLWDIIATVDCTVTNSGAYNGSEVAQLYVGIPGGPAKVLRGFQKQAITTGQSSTFHFDLARRDLSSWDAVSQSWLLQSGSYPIYVGKSVLDIQLTGSLSI